MSTYNALLFHLSLFPHEQMAYCAQKLRANAIDPAEFAPFVKEKLMEKRSAHAGKMSTWVNLARWCDEFIELHPLERIKYLAYAAR